MTGGGGEQENVVVVLTLLLERGEGVRGEGGVRSGGSGRQSDEEGESGWPERRRSLTNLFLWLHQPSQGLPPMGATQLSLLTF